MRRRNKHGLIIEYYCTIKEIEIWKLIGSSYTKKCFVIAASGKQLNYIFDTERFDKGFYILNPKEENWKPCNLMETE